MFSRESLQLPRDSEPREGFPQEDDTPVRKKVTMSKTKTSKEEEKEASTSPYKTYSFDFKKKFIECRNKIGL